MDGLAGWLLAELGRWLLVGFVEVPRVNGLKGNSEQAAQLLSPLDVWWLKGACLRGWCRFLRVR
jgi:hypothetical protein